MRALHVRKRSITTEIRELRERNVDFIIGRGVFPVPEDDLNAEVLFEEPLLVVAGARSRWLDGYGFVNAEAAVKAVQKKH